MTLHFAGLVWGPWSGYVYFMNNKPSTSSPLSLPSPWIVAHADLIPEGSQVLDLAAGKGRHSHYFLQRGAKVTAVDLDCTWLSKTLKSRALTLLEANLESAPWPFKAQSFDAVIVTNYLWRPLFPSIQDVIVPGGILLYETFAVGNEAYGKPSDPDFLLNPGELRDTFKEAFTVLAFEETLDLNATKSTTKKSSNPAVRQRIAARKSTAKIAHHTT
jgi:SAM-dependent methyltransferase